jgi:hypothetical protein
MKRILLLVTLAIGMMACLPDDAPVCNNEIVTIKKKQDFNGIIFTETTYKNTCTNETFIVNTY